MMITDTEVVEVEAMQWASACFDIVQKPRVQLMAQQVCFTRHFLVFSEEVVVEADMIMDIINIQIPRVSGDFLDKNQIIHILRLYQIIDTTV